MAKHDDSSSKAVEGARGREAAPLEGPGIGKQTLVQLSFGPGSRAPSPTKPGAARSRSNSRRSSAARDRRRQPRRGLRHRRAAACPCRPISAR
jgi:hypothetical protein